VAGRPARRAFGGDDSGTFLGAHAPADQLRLMITDPVLLRDRDPAHVCRAAVRGGATMVQVRWKDAAPRDTLALTRALVAALAVPCW
jgi:thiamine monophosphate synthase